jgi:hypothetical protein
MLEILVVLAATIFVFSLFLLVFMIKIRSKGDADQVSACARCNCDRSHEELIGNFAHLKQTNSEVRRCSSKS